MQNDRLRVYNENSPANTAPILMKVFVNIVGIYPQGTLCRLDSGELAVVVRSAL